MGRAARLAALATLVLASARAGLPLRDGEKLTYRVAWAIVPGAGEIRIAARQETAAPAAPRLLVTTTTTTRRLARLLLPFDAESRCLFDLGTGRLLQLEENSQQRDKVSRHRVDFNYDQRVASYARSLPRENQRELPMPGGNPTDLIMGLLQTRTWDLQPGQQRDALVLFDADFYELTLHALRLEDVRTGLGEFRALVLEPRMERTEPKGMFKRGSTVRVWIAQDAHRLPVKFEVEFKIGTGTATLEAYEAPAAMGSHAPDSRP